MSVALLFLTAAGLASLGCVALRPVPARAAQAARRRSR